MGTDRPGVSPYDTYLSSGTRFLIELTAWIAGPWAAESLLAGRTSADNGRAQAYVCRGQTCSAPVQSATELRGLIEATPQ